MYARRKKWDLQEVLVHLNYAKENKYEEHQAHPENKDSRIDHFEIELELIGQLDQEQRQRLLDIARKCPVHRTIDSPSSFTISLVP